MDDYGARLKHLRERKLFTLRRLSHMTYFSPSYIKDIESGNIKPSFETSVIFAKALGVSVSELVVVEEISPDTYDIDFEALIFGQAKTFPEAVEISKKIRDEFKLPIKWLHDFWKKAARLLPPSERTKEYN